MRLSHILKSRNKKTQDADHPMLLVIQLLHAHTPEVKKNASPSKYAKHKALFSVKATLDTMFGI
jgi:hypothetical protein